MHFREKVSWFFRARLPVNCSITGLLWWFSVFLFGAPTPSMTGPTHESLPWPWLPSLGPGDCSPLRVCYESPQSPRRRPLPFLLLPPRLESWGISHGGRGSSTQCPHTRLPRCVHAVGHAQENPCLGREVSKDHPWIIVLLRSLTLFPLSERTLLR